MPADICPKCLKPKSDQAGGSLTQWITSCLCDSESNARQSVEQPEIVRCKNCGKPVREQRSGSLTQWIFQQDSCNCDRPDIEIVRSESTYEQAAFHGFDDDGEVEIELDSEKFPKERYKPTAILGVGVNGPVYLSRDRLLGKRVAVKVLRVFERDALISFQNEARTTSKLSHPNIVKVLDFGITNGGMPFMVMEYLPGTSLDKLINEHGGLEIDNAIALSIMIADALDYAHNSKVLHRDLKPSNILVINNEGSLEAHLIDFGVAKLNLPQSTTVYNGSALVGTPNYMSPDQALGREFDRRSDIYSFGCVMFETLTGQTPFSAETPLELVSLHASQEPPSILDFCPETPITEALASIIGKCLEKDPKLRFPSAEGLKEALQAIPISLLKGNAPDDEETDQELSSASKGKIATSHRAQIWIAMVTAAILLCGFAFVCSTVLKEGSVQKPKAYERKPSYQLSNLESYQQEIPLDSYSGFDVAIQRDPLTIAKGPALIADAVADSDLEKLIVAKPNSQKVIISHSNISPDGLRALRTLPLLRELSLENQPITPAHLLAISELPKLDTLQLKLEHVTERFDGLSVLGRTKLLNLKITQIKVSKEILQDVARIKTLKRLELARCLGFSSLSISELSPLPDLTQLDLSSSDVNDATLKQLSSLKRLNVLGLEYTQITDQFFSTLSNNKTIGRVLILGCSKVSKDSLEKFKAHSKISFLSDGLSTEIDLGSKEILQFTKQSKFNLDQFELGK